MRKLVSATVSAALCLASLAPGIAAAQEYRFTGFEAPRGATATVNLRVPLGSAAHRRPSYGLTLSYGQPSGATLDGRETRRALNLADIRFTGDELSQARLATFDLANLDRDRRMNMAAGGKKTWILVGILIALGVIICVAELCDGDGNDEPSNSPTGPTG
jgi:hypothetical protein